jgi:hypothetical protein
VRCLGAETAKAPPTPRALASKRPEQSGGPRRGENLQASGREEAGLSGRGNSCPAEVVGGDCGIQRSQRHAGTGLPKPRGSEHRASAQGTSPVDSRHRTAPNPQSCARGWSESRSPSQFGRRSVGRCRCKNSPLRQLRSPGAARRGRPSDRKTRGNNFRPGPLNPVPSLRNHRYRPFFPKPRRDGRASS